MDGRVREKSVTRGGALYPRAARNNKAIPRCVYDEYDMWQ